MTHTKYLLTLVSLAAMGAKLVDAQVVRIGSNVSCPSCSIVIEKSFTLHGVDLAGPATQIARDPAGAVYVVDHRDGLLKVFGTDGHLLRQIGRPGAEPGEYEMVRNVIVARDGSIHVLDGMLGRWSVFSQSGTLLRSIPLPVQGGLGMPAVLLRDNQLVVNAVFTAVGDAGYALLRVDEQGKDTRHFDEGAFDLRQKWRQQRRLWERSNGELLVARPYSFSIDVYGSDLTKKRSITRVADWVPAGELKEAPGDGMFDKPYAPRLRAIWEDAEGHLWLHMMVPSPLWKPAPPLEGHASLSPETFSELAKRPRIETIIEVLDSKGERVLARSRIDGPVGLPFGEGYLAQPVQDAGGEPSVVISRVRLKQ